MKANEMWERFCDSIGEKLPMCESWEFGDDADALAMLVLNGDKRATCSAFDIYEIEGEELPKENEYNIILFSNGDAACITRTTKVYTCKFGEISARHAFLEGEGDKSLEYWKEVHKRFFTEDMKDYNLDFSEDMILLCEEFEVIYK